MPGVEGPLFREIDRPCQISLYDCVFPILLNPPGYPSIRIDEAGDAGVGAANHVDAIFYRPKYARDDIVLGANTPVEPSFVGDVDEELRAIFHEFSGQVGKEVLPTDRGGKAESWTLENSELLSWYGRINLWDVNPGPEDGFSIGQIFSKW